MTQRGRPRQPKPAAEYLSVASAAAVVDVSRDTIERALDAGILKYTRLRKDGPRRIKREWLEAVMEGNAVEPLK